MSYIDEKTLPMSFCPGCGHGRIVNFLDEALVQVGVDPHRLVIVTDIGCVGIADKHFRTHAFHGLHGRAITYATGIKLVDPGLTVVVLLGDGGCGIGGTHLINAARRNIGITVLVFNNFNFGMTGGQHSVTTPHGGRTPTTLPGNIEIPLDICATVMAAKAGFVARTTAYEKDVPGLVARAIRHDGFALVDIWELCTAYYVLRNRMNPGVMRDMLAANELATGVLSANNRPEYSKAYRQVFQGAGDGRGRDRVELPARYAHGLEGRTGILLAGSAGEKVRSSATLFGMAAILSGLYATQKDDYPITVMTGHSVSELLVSPTEIAYTGIDDPDAVLLLSDEGVKYLRGQLPALSPRCQVLAEAGLTLPAMRAQVHRLPFKATAAKVDKAVLALVALATYVARSGVFPVDALREAIRRTAKPEVARKQLEAVEAAESLAAAAVGAAAGAPPPPGAAVS